MSVLYRQQAAMRRRATGPMPNTHIVYEAWSTHMTPDQPVESRNITRIDNILGDKYRLTAQYDDSGDIDDRRNQEA